MSRSGRAGVLRRYVATQFHICSTGVNGDIGERGGGPPTKMADYATLIRHTISERLTRGESPSCSIPCSLFML